MLNHLKLIFSIFLLPIILYSMSTGSISGRVISKINNEPIIGCNIIIKGTFLGVSANSDGYFFIDKIPVGFYRIEACYIGYTSIIYDSVFIEEGSITQLQFVLDIDSTIVNTGKFENHNYLREGFQFGWSIKLGHFFSISPSSINIKAKYLKKKSGNCYQFKVEAIKQKYPKFYNEIKSILKRTIKLKKNNDPRIEHIQFTDDFVNYTKLIKEGVLTFWIPTYSLPIPFEKDSTYYFNGKVLQAKPSGGTLFISKGKDLYFAGATHWNASSIDLPLGFPILITESLFLKDHYKINHGNLLTNIENEYKYGKELVLLTQGEQRILGDWMIYQGLARKLKFIEGIHPIDATFNGISFTIVKK